MKKTYFEPEMEVAEMVVSNIIAESDPSKTGLTEGEFNGDEEANKRNTGKEATWGNLW